MTDEQPTDDRLPIFRKFASQLGLPVEVFTGTGDSHPPAIEVDLDPGGERHQLTWRGGSGRTIVGMVTVHADGRVVSEGVPRQQWRPPIMAVDATLAVCVNSAFGELHELFSADAHGFVKAEDIRPRTNIKHASEYTATDWTLRGDTAEVTDEQPARFTSRYAAGAAHSMAEVMAEGSLTADLTEVITARGWKESVAAAAARTVASPDPYADASDDEHCGHGFAYPDCVVCHRTPGGAPNRDPGEEHYRARTERELGEHDPAAVGVALGWQATIERLKIENAEMKARLGIDPDGYSREAAAERCRHGHTDPDCPICHVGERDPDEPEGVELNLRRRKFPPPAAQPQAVAKFRALYSGGMGPTLEVDSNELAHVLNYVQEVEDGVTRSRVRAQDLAAARHEAEQLRAEVADLREQQPVFRMNYSVAVGDAYNDHTKRQADEIERLGTELAQTNRELGEQRALADAMQAGIDQCPNTHNIDWPGDK